MTSLAASSGEAVLGAGRVRRANPGDRRRWPALLGTGIVLTLLLSGCGSTGLPEDFPSTDVPLASVKLSEASAEGAGWSLITSGGADRMDEALARLQEAGFTIVGESRSEVGSTYSLASGSYNVRLGVTDDGKSLTYGVAPTGGTDS